MGTQKHKIKYRKNYRPADYNVKSINLNFLLNPKSTQVYAKSNFLLNDGETLPKSLFLNGENLNLIDIRLNNEQLKSDQYLVDEYGLTLFSPPAEFNLEIHTEINPEGNTELSGLYRTSGNFCTQCEAEGFRRITFFLDRPDVLSKYTTRIEASKKESPVLLSNGNLIEKGDLPDGKHYAVWEDPYLKPCYLFALVAGDLVSQDDKFTTKSGNNVSLQIFVEKRNQDKCDHAMRSLKNAMKWDEDVYGLEYDLKNYMIVAVDDFNMGAMENKGLNVFNSKYVLSSPETATDQDYLAIEGVIAHEYFHNWTGNRITCRDWFQLSLKEGLTVFRDQEFSADMNSRAVKRIEDVKILRSHQFREDSTPMAHPIRPDSYVEINNFYTVTVYNKGAEVIRMIHQILGKERFHKGMDLYVERFDGMAVTCEDFIKAMEDGSGKNLSQFRNWYSQAGTPILEIKESWDDEQGELRLHIHQKNKDTAMFKKNKPFHIPVKLGFLTKEGDGYIDNNDEEVIEITKNEEEFIFNGFKKKPLLSFLRNFSSPVLVRNNRSKKDLSLLMSYDSDLFNRWEAANILATMVIKEVMEKVEEGGRPILDKSYLEALRKNILDDSCDKALLGYLITLPTEQYVGQECEYIDPQVLHRSVEFVKKEIGLVLREELLQCYEKNHENGSYQLTNESIGKRSLKNACLGYLMTAGEDDSEILDICIHQYKSHKNMTDVAEALKCLTHCKVDIRDEIFEDFYQKWSKDPLVVDKWLYLQSISNLDNTLARVKRLTEHPAFSMKNPNKIRSLIGTFSGLNHFRFHDEKGDGYKFLAQTILQLDEFNPQIAARLVTPFTNHRKYIKRQKDMMIENLKKILGKKNLSSDVFEIVSKTLN